MKNDLEVKSRLSPIGVFFISCFCVVIATVIYTFGIKNYVIDPEARGVFGDQFGGLTALFSGLAFAGLIVTLYMQQKDLSAQREELKRSNLEFALQRFDSSFFGMIKMLNDHVSSITYGNASGRLAISKLSMVIKRECQDVRLSVIGAMDEVLKDDEGRFKKELSNIFVEHDNNLGPYFRILHNVYRLIDAETNLDKKQKSDYARIARAQISLAELDLIFINGVTNQAEKFKPLIEKFAILKHTSPTTIEQRIFIRKMYKDSAFSAPKVVI